MLLQYTFSCTSFNIGCYDSNSVVRVRITSSGKMRVRTKTLGELEVGEIVESYDPNTDSVTFSKVYFITHQESSANFSRLLKLVYGFNRGKQLSIRLGDLLWVRNAIGQFSPTTIIGVSEKRCSVRHPMTTNHYIVVDGVLSSVHVYDELLYRLLTAPLRVLYHINPDITNTSLVKKLVSMWDLVENYLL